MHGRNTLQAGPSIVDNENLQ